MSRPPARSKSTTPIVVAVVAAVIAGVMLLAPALGGDSDEAAQERPVATSREGGRPPLDKNDPLLALTRREADDPMARGDVDAPVVMVNYSDFQCPFCGKFARETEPELVKRYVEDGTLRIEWRDFPYLGPESTTAAHAGRAAAAQGEFWAFHDALYDDQQPPNSGKLTEDYLVGVAKKIGLDAEQFRKDMRSDAADKAVSHDFQEGQSVGVTGTPAFVVNGMPIMGAQPLEVFADAIEQAADEAR